MDRDASRRGASPRSLAAHADPPGTAMFLLYSDRSLPLANPLGPPHLELLAVAQTSAMKYLARVTLIFRGACSKRRGCTNSTRIRACVRACVHARTRMRAHDALGTRKSYTRQLDIGCRITSAIIVRQSICDRRSDQARLKFRLIQIRFHVKNRNKIIRRVIRAEDARVERRRLHFLPMMMMIDDQRENRVSAN
jgi:hypothetical protein